MALLQTAQGSLFLLGGISAFARQLYVGHRDVPGKTLLSSEFSFDTSAMVDSSKQILHNKKLMGADWLRNVVFIIVWAGALAYVRNARAS